MHEMLSQRGHLGNVISQFVKLKCTIRNLILLIICPSYAYNRGVQVVCGIHAFSST